MKKWWKRFGTTRKDKADTWNDEPVFYHFIEHCDDPNIIMDMFKARGYIDLTLKSPVSGDNFFIISHDALLKSSSQ